MGSPGEGAGAAPMVPSVSVIILSGEEERVKWVVTIDDVEIEKAIEQPVKTQKVATPLLREGKQGNKKVG